MSKAQHYFCFNSYEPPAIKILMVLILYQGGFGVKKFIVLVCCLLVVGTANAAVIDIVEMADGSFQIFSDGALNGHATSRAGAQKVADKLAGKGNTINWKKAATSPNPAASTSAQQSSASGAGATKKLPSAGVQAQKTLPAGPAQKALPAGPAQKALPAAQTPKALPAGPGGVNNPPTVTATPKVNIGGAALAVGAVVGASGAGAKMFSETDCEMDPVTQQYACCNVSDLTNIQARYCNIGDEMFSAFPYVRTCMQGNNKFESNWFKARFLDDHWSSQAEVKFCSGYVMPAPGDYNIQRYGSSEAAGKVCWKWECADPGMQRQGNKCVSGNSAGANMAKSEKSQVNKNAKAGDACQKSDLPQYATSGVYIKSGNGVTCAATNCADGTHLVKNSAGQSQGWCRAGAPVATTNDKDDALAGSAPQNDDMAASAEKVADSRAATTVQDNCSLGVPGYVKYLGACITVYEMQEIKQAQQEAERQRSMQRIDDAYKNIKNLTSSLESSVWKDKHGNFNTSRLVSDSVAGVVLGSAGGLVTSNVIKKNQIKSGFDDIKCVIGGQVVADFGDEFNVGRQ